MGAVLCGSGRRERRSAGVVSTHVDSDWCSSAEAVAILRPKYGDRAEAVIAERCAKGLLEARADVVVSTYDNVFEQANIADFGWRDVPVEDSRSNSASLSWRFWSIGHARAGIEPTADLSGFGRTIWADWSIGDFGYRQEHYGEPSGWTNVEAAGVMFCRRQIMHLMGHIQRGAQLSVERASKYDWERAISAFCAAQWQQDIIPDIYAHGAMAAIGDWLAGWFALSGNIPSDTAIKTRARMILDDMKRADKA